MCSHPGVDKNIDVPLSDDRFFICIYIYVCIENTKMDRSFKNPYSIYFRMIVYDLYIYIQHYPTMKASRLLRHLRHLRV